MSSYLTISETSTTINVSTDDWEIEFDEAKGGVIDKWCQDGGSTNYASSSDGLFSFINRGASYWYQNNTTGAIMTLVESGPNKVVIKAVGEMDDVAGHDFEITYTVYTSGHIFIRFIFTNNTGGDLACTSYNNLGLLKIDFTNYTNSAAVVDDYDNYPTYNKQFWYGLISTDDFNSVILYILHIENSKSYQQTLGSSSSSAYYYHNDSETFSDGERYITNACLYIGGQETSQAEIEADGEYLLDFVII